ncbi:MAG: tyrosine-type recombinase/integrase [Velocimicrobium sp.]
MKCICQFCASVGWLVAFATRYFEAGIKPKTVQQYLGHATLQMTMDLYTHVLKEHSQEEMTKLEKGLDDTLDKRHSDNRLSQ